MSLLLTALSTIAPAKCVICRREGVSLCAVCASNLVTALPDRCWRCQKLTLGSKTCSTCRRTTPLNYVWVVGEYNNGLKSVVQAFKFERRRDLARPLAELCKARLPQLSSQPIITHVPTATGRRRQRGYDQAELLALELARQTGWSHIPLLRRQTQARQLGAKRMTRLAQLDNSFRTVRREYVTGQMILLIDDVTTTGATLTACAKELRLAGAKSISAVVLAQRS